MKKLIFLFAILMLLLTTAQLRAELSLEAKQAVEEIRSRLYDQKEAVAKETGDSQASVKEKYVVGAELNQALKRLRSVLYSSKRSKKYLNTKYISLKAKDRNRITHKIRTSVKKTERFEKTKPAKIASNFERNATDDKEAVDYEPGKRLRQALDKVKESHKSLDIHNFELEVDSGFAAEPGHFEGGLKQKDFEKVVEVVIGDSDQTLSGSGNTDNTVKQPSATSKPEEPEKENLEINRKLEKYEFRMPGDYRIIVR